MDYYSQMRITAAEPGKVNFELMIELHNTNGLGILHGGTLATMVDVGGSLALASRGLYSTGVSTDLTVTYLNAGGRVGDLVKGQAVCDKCKTTSLIPFLLLLFLFLSSEELFRANIDLQSDETWPTLRSSSGTAATTSSPGAATPNSWHALGKTPKTT